MNVRGTNAIVTGGAAGIGRAAAVELARRGARGIVLADVDEAGLEETARLVTEAGSEARIVPTDVRRTSDLEAMYRSTLDAFGSIEVVFNNAGIVSGPPPYPDTPIERIRTVLEIDLTAVVVSTTLAIRHMRGRGGVVVNTASTGGLQPLPQDATYAAAKAGVIHFSRSCGGLHESTKVRVNAICPGVTETAILEKTGGGRRPDWLGPLLEAIEILTPEDVAREVLRIVEDDGIVGEAIVLENRAKVAS